MHTGKPLCIILEENDQDRDLAQQDKWDWEGKVLCVSGWV